MAIHGGAEFAVNWFSRLSNQIFFDLSPKVTLKLAVVSPYTYILQQVLTYNTGIGEESMAIQGELSLLCIDFHGSQIVLSPNPTLLSNRNPVDSWTQSIGMHSCGKHEHEHTTIDEHTNFCIAYGY